MSILEAIANNIGSIITGVFTIMAATWGARVSHNRTVINEVRKEKIIRIEQALKEGLKLRAALTDFVVFMQNNLDQGGDLFYQRDNNSAHEPMGLVNDTFEDVEFHIIMLDNEKVKAKFDDLANHYRRELCGFIEKNTNNVLLSDLNVVSIPLVYKAQVLLDTVQNELKNIIK